MMAAMRSASASNKAEAKASLLDIPRRAAAAEALSIVPVWRRRPAASADTKVAGYRRKSRRPAADRGSAARPGSGLLGTKRRGTDLFT